MVPGMTGAEAIKVWVDALKPGPRGQPAPAAGSALTDDELVSEAVQRVLEQGEEPDKAIATVITRKLIREGLEEMATAHLILSA